MTPWEAYESLKLTTYIGERQRTRDGFLADALLDLYGEAGIATSILLRGVEGFGLRHHLRTDHSLTLSEDLPAVVVAVDGRERIEAVRERTVELAQSGLVTVEGAHLRRDLVDVPPGLLREETTKLTLYLGRRERLQRVPAFVAVCDLLHRRGISGGTVLLGVDGTVRGERQRAGFFRRNAEVPMMLIAVGAGDRIESVLPELRTMLAEPILTLERVQVCKRDGVLLEPPRLGPATDEHGLPVWHKLMVYTSEATLHDGAPIHRAITRRLRATGARGSTTVRGIWGFHGDHAPHGDRPLQVARHAPTVTIVIDTAEGIARSFEVVDELTAERGLVTSELVPSLPAAGR